MKDKPVVLILGVGRSGTTALYSLLQEILEFNFPGTVAYSYEPFLWDQRKLPKFAKDVGGEFDTVESLAIPGIAQHLKLPLLSSPGDRLDKADEDFLRTFCECPDQNEALLAKLIRANGRFSYLRELAPKAKVIFLLRNPVDVINSAIGMFSFYGDEFHPSDYDRFVAEVTTLFPKEVDAFPRETSVQREAFFWYFSNLHCLQSSRDDPLCKVIAHENYSTDRRSAVDDIAEFLELALPEDVLATAERSIGWVNKHANLSSREVEALRPYLLAYKETLLPLAGLEVASVSTIQGIRDVPEQRRRRERYKGAGPLSLIREAVASELHQERVRGLRSRIAELTNDHEESVRGLQTQIAELTDRYEKTMQAQRTEIDELQARHRDVEQALRSENAELEARHQSAEQSLRAEIAELTDRFEDRLEEARDVLDMHEREVSDLREELSQADLRVSRLEEQIDQAARLSGDLEKRLEVLHELRVRVRVVSAYKNPIKKFRAYRALIAEEHDSGI